MSLDLGGLSLPTISSCQVASGLASPGFSAEAWRGRSPGRRRAGAARAREVRVRSRTSRTVSQPVPVTVVGARAQMAGGLAGRGQPDDPPGHRPQGQVRMMPRSCLRRAPSRPGDQYHVSQSRRARRRRTTPRTFSRHWVSGLGVSVGRSRPRGTGERGARGRVCTTCTQRWTAGSPWRPGSLLERDRGRPSITDGTWRDHRPGGSAALVRSRRGHGGRGGADGGHPAARQPAWPRSGLPRPTRAALRTPKANCWVGDSDPALR